MTPAHGNLGIPPLTRDHSPDVQHLVAIVGAAMCPPDIPPHEGMLRGPWHTNNTSSGRSAVSSAFLSGDSGGTGNLVPLKVQMRGISPSHSCSALSQVCTSRVTLSLLPRQGHTNSAQYRSCGVTRR